MILSHLLMFPFLDLAYKVNGFLTYASLLVHLTFSKAHDNVNQQIQLSLLCIE